jgi:hypothetical protein
MKLDTHGAEIAILNGASQALEQTAALVVEVYNFELVGPSTFFEIYAKK